jgi:hypothetical protein
MKRASGDRALMRLVQFQFETGTHKLTSFCGVIATNPQKPYHNENETPYSHASPSI